MIKGSRLALASIYTALLAFPLKAMAEGHPLIGVNYPPLPEEVEEIGGWKAKSPYVVKRVVYNSQKSLLLGRLIQRDSQGKGSYKVVDVLTLPPINTETEEITGRSCLVNGKKDLNMIAIIKSEDGNTEFLTRVRKAWRIEGEKFNEVDVTNYRFKCENYSYGL